MADVLLSSNSTGMNGKWVPYIYKPFFIGQFTAPDNTGDDGEAYISRTDSTGSTDVNISAVCTSPHNCGYYYLLVFTTGPVDNFYVRKYDNNDVEVDRIYASATSSTGRFWRCEMSYITIDIGVHVYFPTKTGFASGDIYKIELPNLETIEKNKLYHGGYSTFLRLPYTEDIAFHSEPIPTDLKNRNMTFLLGQKLPTTKTRVSSKMSYLSSAVSQAAYSNNSAVSLSLEWNVNKDGIHASSNEAGNVADAWGGNETWSLGTLIVDDVDPIASTDVPSIGHSPSSDVSADTYTSGENQILNTTVAGRAGTAAIRLAYFEGTGSSKTHAYNQFWPITIMLS